MSGPEAVQAANSGEGIRQMTEPAEAQLKRLKIRAWRRGMRETDLVLGPYADACLAEMDGESLSAFEALLAESDQDIHAWVTGAAAPPPRHAPLVRTLARFAHRRHR